MTYQDLFNQCDQLVTRYPAGTNKLPTGYPIAGRGFFPVVSGSFHNGCLMTQITHRKLLFVGQDWGCEDNLNALSDADADIKSGTGKILLDLLDEAEIPQKECFFTNALFGVRTGERNTGRSPGWNDLRFRRMCRDALNLQIETIQPKAIVSLGRDAPRLLAEIIEPCKTWNSARNFEAIHLSGSAMLELRPAVSGVGAAAILTHPSYRHINAVRRTWGAKNGHQAEVDLLKSLWKFVGKY